MRKFKIKAIDKSYYVVYSENIENAVKKLRDATLAQQEKNTIGKYIMYIDNLESETDYNSIKIRISNDQNLSPKSARELLNSLEKQAKKRGIKDSNISDYQPKEISHSRLEAIPLQARQELQNSKNKGATLLSIEGNIEDIINAAEPSNREELKQMGSKITNDLRKQFKITDNEIKDDNNSEYRKELAKWQDLYINKKLITSSELSEKAKELRQKYNIKDEKLTSESILEKAKSLGGQAKQNGATGVLGISITSPQRSDEFADWLEKNNIHYNSDGRQYYVEIQDCEIEDKLIQSGSEEAFKKNIATEIRAGKDPKQAAAIAYSVQRENDMSATDFSYVIPGKRVPEHNVYYNKVTPDELKTWFRKVMSEGNDTDVVNVLIGKLSELKKDYQADINNSNLNKEDTKRHYGEYKKIVNSYRNSQISKEYKNAVDDFIATVRDSVVKDSISKVENIGKFTLWQDEDTKEYYFDATISRSGKKLHRLNTTDINKAREKVKKELVWITDSAIEDSYYTESEKKDKQFVKNAIEEMEGYINNWNFLTARQKRDIGSSREQLKARVAELKQVKDSSIKDAYDYIGNAMVFKSLPKIGEKAQKYGFGYSNSVISKIEKTYNKDGYQFYRVYCMDEEDYKNNHGTQYYYSVAIKDSNIVRDYSIEDAEELPHITKEQWNKIPKDYKTTDPATGKKQAFAGSLGIAPGGTTLLTEGKHFVIDAENKEKNWTYVMFGTTGEKKVENLTKAEAEHLLNNNKLLGYSGKIYETVRDNDTNNTNKILDSDIVVARSLDELISKIKSWDGETTTNYILSPKSSGWYFDYFITMGHKYSYYAYIKKTAHGRHDNPNVDISKQNIDKTVTAKTAQELIDQVVRILK